jgi:bacterioferritin
MKGEKLKGNQKVIDILNEVLSAELTAINQYFIHAKMCEDWGYLKLYEHIEKESIDEMRHAEVLIARILYLEGTPNMDKYFKLRIGKNFEQILENDYALESEAVNRLQRGIKICTENDDHGSQELLKQILSDEELHIEWMESQKHLISEIGIANYLSKQMFDEKNSSNQ